MLSILRTRTTDCFFDFTLKQEDEPIGSIRWTPRSGQFTIMIEGRPAGFVLDAFYEGDVGEELDHYALGVVEHILH